LIAEFKDNLNPLEGNYRYNPTNLILLVPSTLTILATLATVAVAISISSVSGLLALVGSYSIYNICREFVVPSGVMCYPEYLVTFKQSSNIPDTSNIPSMSIMRRTL
jgi:hypothetical protein